MQAGLVSQKPALAEKKADLDQQMDHGVWYGSSQDCVMICNGLSSAGKALQPSLSIISRDQTLNNLQSDSGRNASDSSPPLLLVPPPRALVRDIQRDSFQHSSNTATDRGARTSLPTTDVRHPLKSAKKTIVPQLDDQLHKDNVQSSTFSSSQAHKWLNNVPEAYDETFCETSSTATTKSSSLNRPRFLSDEAELFWHTFGGTDPSRIGSILNRAIETGSTIQDWIIICSATADPVVRELVTQMHIIDRELKAVLTESDRPHVDQLKIYLRSEPAWWYDFSEFRYQAQLENWHARFDKLCLLHHEYQSIEAQLDTQQLSMIFKPKLVMNHLRNIKKWRVQLDGEMEKTLRTSQHTEELTKQKLEQIDPSNAGATHKSSFSWNKNYTTTLAQSSSLEMGTRNKSSSAGDIRLRFQSLANLRAYGRKRAAYGIASCLALFATLATILSVWRCTPTSTSLYADSNFWSTCSQMFLGLGSIYCLLIPILQNAKLDVSRPTLFKWLLVASFVAAVVAVAVYHSHIQTSLIFALISGLTALAATLLLIKDAGNQIIEKTLQVDWLEDEVVRLRADRNR